MPQVSVPGEAKAVLYRLSSSAGTGQREAHGHGTKRARQEGVQGFVTASA
jgi:hypothetical protein